jgi:NAD(P)-dependent dehydrogenase (short-subunit alcohol dehydrogenase family)
LTTERLKGRVAVVTGAAQGIGYGIAKAFAAEGAKVVLLDLMDTVSDAAKTLCANCSPMTDNDAVSFQLDVADAKQVSEVFGKIMLLHGRIDILVNNVAICVFVPFLDLSDEMRDRIFDVNVKGAWNCAKAALPSMIQNRYGRIINMSSTAAIGSSKGLTAYSASKGAVSAFSRALALDVAEYGINVNTIIPCYVDTPGLREAAAGMGDDPNTFLDRLGKSVPLGRVATIDDIGDLAVFLASGESRYITGQEIVIDGGNVIQTVKASS